jgi:hypothetical protein
MNTPTPLRRPLQNDTFVQMLAPKIIYLLADTNLLDIGRASRS